MRIHFTVTQSLNIMMKMSLEPKIRNLINPVLNNNLLESERSHSCTSFRMFTTSSVLSSVRKGDYVFKIDLQDAYVHVPIYPSSRKYLGFAFENKVYQFQVLPFGLNTAPQVFTRLGHTVTGYLHHQGISLQPLSAGNSTEFSQADNSKTIQPREINLTSLDSLAFYL